MDQMIIKFLPEADLEELLFLESISAEMEDEELQDFLIRYKTHRRKPEIVVLFAAHGIYGCRRYS